MLLETAGAVCHTFVTLAIAALACNDAAIWEMEQCRKKRISLHMDFLMFEKKDVFSSFSLQEVAWEHELGRGCVGVIRKAGLRGRPAAVKSPRHDGPLGYAGSAAEIQREIEVAMLVPNHPCLCRLIGWFAVPQALSVWELVPSGARMRDVLLQPGACNLVGALSFLGDALAHLDQHPISHNFWLPALRRKRCVAPVLR